MKSENVASMDLENVEKHVAQLCEHAYKIACGASVQAFIADGCVDLMHMGATPDALYQAASNLKHESLKAQIVHQDPLFSGFDYSWWKDEQFAGYAMLIMAWCFSQHPEYKKEYKAMRDAYIARRAERRLAWHKAGKELKPPKGETA